MHHWEPLASCFLFKPCAPQLPGDWLELALGLWTATGVWAWVLWKVGLLGMGRQ